MDPRIKIAKTLRERLESISVKTGAFPASLEGACAIASFALARDYVKNGYDALVVHSRRNDIENKISIEHCWVEIDGHGIDITATQFGKRPKILAFHLNKAPEEYRLGQIDRYHPMDPSTKKVFSGWPEYQQPNPIINSDVLEHLKDEE